MCNSVATEAKKTSSICFVLLNTVPTVPKTEKDLILKEELLLLAQHVNCLSPCIQASGFFPLITPWLVLL